MTPRELSEVLLIVRDAAEEYRAERERAGLHDRLINGLLVAASELSGKVAKGIKQHNRHGCG